MKTLKVLVQDIECHNCHRKVNRKRAEAEDWTEVTFVDGGGMGIHRVFICQHCEDSWNHDKFEVVK
jgi:predicted metal-binding protein